MPLFLNNENHVLPRMSREDVIIIENGKKKMGRPIAGDEAKNKRISLRATETTFDKFQKCSDCLKKSKTDLLEEMVDNLYNETFNR